MLSEKGLRKFCGGMGGCGVGGFDCPEGPLVVYFTWARFEFGRRFFDVMGGIAIALLSLYVGIYWGIRI